MKNGNYFCENSFLCKTKTHATMVETEKQKLVSKDIDREK